MLPIKAISVSSKFANLMRTNTGAFGGTHRFSTYRPDFGEHFGLTWSDSVKMRDDFKQYLAGFHVSVQEYNGLASELKKTWADSFEKFKSMFLHLINYRVYLVCLLFRCVSI